MRVLPTERGDFLSFLIGSIGELPQTVQAALDLCPERDRVELAVESTERLALGRVQDA